jgi:RNA polymerase sigma-70 factor (ECF subfamily)
MDDDELIASLADGDDTALRELFDRHAPWLAARLRKALPSDDVEDQAALLLRKRGPVTQALLDERGPVSDLAEAAATRTDLGVAALGGVQ